MKGRRSPKGKSKSQGTNATRHLELVPTDARVQADDAVPKPPPGLSAPAKKRWANFWRSKLAAYVDPGSDLHRLERWIEDVDEFDTLRKAYAKERIVEGSQKQPRLNPIASRLAQLEKQIRDAENDFGMTPAARLKLGISFGSDGPTTADDLNRMIDDAGRGTDGDEVEAGVEEDFATGFSEA